MDDFLARVHKDVSTKGARFGHEPDAGAPNTIAMHPETWYAVVRAIADRPLTFTGAPVPRPTLFGMEVVEDASLARGTWRLERRRYPAHPAPQPRRG